MSDSCNPRKLDPGLAARYSKPSDLITSTMKSDPGRSVVCTSTCAQTVVSAETVLAVGEGAAARRGSDCGALGARGGSGLPTSVDGPAAAADGKPRRWT